MDFAVDILAKDNICRACLQISNRVCKLDSLSVKRYFDICGIKSTEDDPLPRGLCLWCFSQFTHMTKFRVQCQRSQLILMQHWDAITGKIDLCNLRKNIERVSVNKLSQKKLFAISCNEHKNNDTKTNHRKNTQKNQWKYPKKNLVENSDNELSDNIFYLYEDTLKNDSAYDLKNCDEREILSFDTISVEPTRVNDLPDVLEIVYDDTVVKDESDGSFAYGTGFESEDGEFLKQAEDTFTAEGDQIKKTTKRLTRSTVKKKTLRHSLKRLKKRLEKEKVEKVGFGKEVEEFDIGTLAKESMDNGQGLEVIGDVQIKLENIEEDLWNEDEIKEERKKDRRKKGKAIKEKSIQDEEVTVKKGRTIYYRFDSTSVQLLRQTEEQVKEEMDTTRAEQKYLAAPYRCEPCAKYFVTETSLHSHRERHLESAGDLVCSVCTLRYCSERSLRIHMQTHTDRYRCAVCSRVFCARSAAMRHAAKHSGREPVFQCSVCGNTTSCANTHKKHMRTHAGEKRYGCSQCPKEFRNSTTRNLHVMRAHTAIRHFACASCPMTFVNKTALVAHSVKHSERRDFYCVECDVHFKTASILKCHLTTSVKHMDPSTFKYQCEVCARRYPALHRLREHVESAHARRASHVCEACGHACHTHAALRRHLRQRHPQGPRERKHKCHTCDKAFLTRQTLKSHQLTHTGERPYPCPTCGKTFRHTAALWTHTKLLHKDPAAVG